MQNLKLYSRVSLDAPLRFEHESILFSAFDVENNRIFFASSSNLIYSFHLPSSEEGRGSHEPQLSSDIQQINLDSGDSITAMDYIMEKEALLVGTTNGCLILHSVDSRATEVVGSVDGGVRAIACSPDGSLVALTAGLGQLLVLTLDWEVLFESLPDTEVSYDAIEHDHVFQSPVSWRGDGKYFATFVKDNDTLLRRLRIWERESGSWNAMSEPRAFMSGSLDWMPSGAKVATVINRSTEKKCPVVVFYEKNGLERSSFSIDDQTEATVRILKWNYNSDLLAASIACNDFDAIRIWYFSNNRWYLKQEIRYDRKDEVKFVWDTKNPFHLISWTSSSVITTYKFLWVTAVTESSNAYVIDNSKLLISPLAQSLVPPPMYLFCIKFKAPIQELAFLSVGVKTHFAAYLSDGSLCVVELPKTDDWEQMEGNDFFVESSITDLSIGKLIHLAWLGPQKLISVSHHQTKRHSTEVLSGRSAYFHSFLFQEIDLTCSEDSFSDSFNSFGWRGNVSRCVPLERSVIAVAPNLVQKYSAFLQMEGGSVLEYTSHKFNSMKNQDSFFHKLDSSVGFTCSCPTMKSVLISENGIQKSLVFGLDKCYRLHVGEKLLCDGCSSFSFYSTASWVPENVVTHLLLTKDDSLFVINIDDVLAWKPEMSSRCQHNSHKRGEKNRNVLNIWERGAQLIGAIHGDEAVIILQTLRGNLECIYPRKLILVSIFDALAKTRFKDAILMVRRHRIDFNVIVDYFGCEAFVKLSSLFVTQVQNLNHITDFVSSIKNENVINTLYKDYVSLPSHDNKPDQKFGSDRKISTVLLAVRRALEEQVQESPARELCILTTLARCVPPALEEALKRVKTVREMEISGNDFPKRGLFPSAEESLKHLLWLTDPEAVYDAALGVYDLNLAAIVALNSQKDPKEFLPFLRELEQLPLHIMRYKIDMKLHQYESALKNIVQAGIDDYFDDCMNLMKNHPELFPLGLHLLNDDLKRKQVQEAWGDHLLEEKRFQEAADAYLCCSSLQNALKAYRSGGGWKGVFIVAGLLKLDKDEVLRLAHEVCEELQVLGKPSDAAKVSVDYCGDVVRGVELFMSAREWEEAIRFSFMHDKDYLVSDVKETALECATSLTSDYHEATDKVKKYLTRYLAVRQRRLVLASKIRSEDRIPSDAEFDSVSEASSNFTDMSAYTTRSLRDSTPSISSSTTTSKAREQRRRRNKGGKIRAGSPGEEVALVEHLKGMSLADGPQRELRSLIHALLFLGEEKTARELQEAVSTFVLTQEAAVELAEDTTTDKTLDETSQNLDHYMWKMRFDTKPSCRLWQSKVLLPP